jgi:hypothetical protein
VCLPSWLFRGASPSAVNGCCATTGGRAREDFSSAGDINRRCGAMTAIALVLSALLVFYLAVALVRPEWFE